jgi:hypothetical protein
MYKRLSKVLVFSIVGIVSIFIVNIYTILKKDDSEWIPKLWKWRWLLLDGCLNVNYFLCFISIAIIWMPVTQNSKLGLIQLDSEEGLDFDHFELEDVDDDEIIEWAERNIAEPLRKNYLDVETMN